MKLKALSLLIAMCMVFSLFPAADAAGAHKSPAEKAPVSKQNAAAPAVTAPVLPLSIEEYPVLELDVETTISCNPSEYTYVTFTPEVSGFYRFTSTGNTDTIGRLCDAEMIPIYESDDCEVKDHNHANTLNFCITAELEANVTYVLGVIPYGNEEVDVTIGVSITHKYTAVYDEISGTIVYTCPCCGDSYSAACAALEYDTDTAITIDGTETVYVVFIPDTDGRYRFTSTGDFDTIGQLFDSDMNEIEYNDDCHNYDHAHEYGLNFCISAELQGGATYVLGIRFWGDNWGTVSIHVGCCHSFTTEIISSPTCAEPGQNRNTCAECGTVKITETAPLGHVYNMDHLCTRCGEPLPTDGTWGSNLTWTLNGDVLTISGEGDMAPAAEIFDDDGEFYDYYMPWYDLAFSDLVIEEGVTSITYYAFTGLEQLRTVSLPQSLMGLPYECFYNCVNLTGPVVIPEGITRLPEYCFRGCRSLDEIVLHDGITDLGWYGLSGTGLTSIHIPAGVEYLEYALAHCDKLARITVSENSPYFAHDDQGAMYTKDMTELVMVPPAYSGVFVIPEGVTRVDYAPMIDDSSSFSDCDQITEIYIPASLEHIYAHSLLSSKLTAIHVAEGNPSLFDVDGVLYGDMEAYYDMEGFNPEGVKRYLVRVPALKEVGDFTVPEDVEVINPYTFRGCKYLDEVSIPAGCEVDLSAFNNSSVTAIRIAEGHEKLYSDANGVVFNQDLTVRDYDYELDEDVETFYPAGTRLMCYPKGLSGFYAVPEGVTSLAGTSFYGSAVKALRLPATLTEIDDYALASDALKWVLFTGEKPAVGYDFPESNRTVYYPGWLDSWSDPSMGWGDSNTYIPYEQGQEPVYNSNPFTDVVAGKFYYKSVLWAVENDITSGLTATTFGPTENCTRGQVVTFLWRAAGSPEPKTTSHPFTDVKEGAYYYKAMLWAVENGITKGTTATTFGPKVVCNRGTVVTFLHRAKGEPAPTSTAHNFTDVKEGKFYYNAMLWAVENEITSGISKTLFAPNDSCNRGQVVTFLYRAYANQ